MKIDRVTIVCKDKSKYTQIAFLVDRDDFRTDAYVVRRKWLKSDILIPVDEYIDWWFALTEKSNEKQENKDFQKRREELYAKIFNQYAEAGAKNGTDSAVQKAREAYKSLEKLEKTVEFLDFEHDIKGLLTTYHLPETYYHAMSYTIICGHISEDLWSSCEAGLEKPYERSGWGGLIIKEPYCHFTITAYTTKDDLIELYKKNIPAVRELYRKSEYGLMEYAKDTISNIKRDREWYWKRILPKEQGGKPKSALQIAKEEFGKVEGYSQESMIDEALKQYEKNLHRSLGRT